MREDDTLLISPACEEMVLFPELCAKFPIVAAGFICGAGFPCLQPRMPLLHNYYLWLSVERSVVGDGSRPVGFVCQMQLLVRLVGKFSW